MLNLRENPSGNFAFDILGFFQAYIIIRGDFHQFFIHISRMGHYLHTLPIHYSPFQVLKVIFNHHFSIKIIQEYICNSLNPCKVASGITDWQSIFI